jgi:hypothetical protein
LVQRKYLESFFSCYVRNVPNKHLKIVIISTEFTVLFALVAVSIGLFPFSDLFSRVPRWSTVIGPPFNFFAYNKYLKLYTHGQKC